MGEDAEFQYVESGANPTGYELWNNLWPPSKELSHNWPISDSAVIQ